MSNKIHLKKWESDGSQIKLTYEDDSVLYIKKSDFNRAFGAIISADKEVIKRDFAI